MKQIYIAPEMNVVELDTEAMMLTISAPGEDYPTWEGPASGLEADAPVRRGTWGNLWADAN